MLKLPRDIVGITPIGDSDKTGPLGILYRPDQSKGRVKQGIVKYIGSGVKDAKIGDYVFFSGYAGIVFRLEGEGTLIFMPEDNISSTLLNRTTDVPGLFFYGGEGKYFTATYEQAMILIARAMEKFEVTIKDPEDRFREDKKSAKIEQGKLFVIKEQEHELGENCYCQLQAREYNKGVCPNCSGRLHYYQNPLKKQSFYSCEKFTHPIYCTFNTLEN